jgi:Sep-tRNA:Cys-tRNA synthetase
MDPRNRQEDFINLNPIQAGGRTSAKTRVLVNSYIDGYAVCDQCKGALSEIPKPDIVGLKMTMIDFLGVNTVRFTHGAREAKYLVMENLLEIGDSVVVDENAHYSTFIGIEKVKAKKFIVSNTGYPKFKIIPEKYEQVIKKVKKETNKFPKLLVITQVDGHYGNFVNVKKINEIAKKYDIPLLVNSAYLVGRAEVKLNKLGADFIIGSGHKSFGAPGNVGILGVSNKWAEKLFQRSSDFPKKEVDSLGCTARNAAIVGLAVAMESINQRVKKWDEEIKKANWLVNKLERLGGFNLLGEKPKQHDLIYLETPVINKIAQSHRKRGYFFASALKDKGIIGIRPGLSKAFKLSTYGLTWSQVEYVYKVIKDVAKGE